MIWMLATALAAPCDAAHLDPAMERAEQAFLRKDLAVLKVESKGAKLHLSCANPEQVARYYRVEALRAQLEGNPKRTERALAASLAAHPLLPLGHQLAADPELANALQRAQEAPSRFRAGSPQLINGLRTPLVPTVAHVGSSPGKGVQVVGLGLGVLAAGLYGSAWVSRGTFNKTLGLPATERLRSYHATNRLSLASMTAAIAGGTLVGISFAL